MGRIRTSLIKRAAEEVIKLYGSKLSGSFEANKSVISGAVSTQSQKLRNKVIGYATHLMKKGEDTGRPSHPRDSEQKENI